MRIVIAQFCDDIRREIGGKYSMMGIYGDELIADKLPIVLPKFCIQIRAVTPVEKVFTRLLFRVFINENQLAQADFAEDELAKLSATLSAKFPDAKRHSVISIMQFSPLVITEPSRIRVEAQTEDEVIEGSYIYVRSRTAEDAPKVD
jgi:hypothetical protein